LPILIIVINILIISVRWNSLPELLPAHFDLKGNASGTMSRNMLLLYTLAETVLCLFAYVVARIKQKLQLGLIILTSGVSLVLLSSTLVSLTSGTMPVFMLVEPVILLVAIIGFIVSVVKSHNNIN
ncbi:MAG: DUF1648 domain-containing protein, partial [Bacteroidaceae bacterium]|nr:DUF1648 domain-containing protein [Bacteroidaceae bacterium]